MKKIAKIMRSRGGHWVGDGFPVQSLFFYGEDGEAISPFLLFDYAGPHDFAPAKRPRGVGEHPHRGFETVTIVYDGEVAHKDSAGNGGVIGPGDVQWMTAASGILHQEFHSPAFTRSGGRFHVVQLWVNLPAKDKMSAPHYQPILDKDIPAVERDGARVRVIAGEFDGAKGPATTFTPINLWDVRLAPGAEFTFDAPEGHTAMVAVLSGRVAVNGQQASDAEVVRFERDGSRIEVWAHSSAMLLVMTGEPIEEPIVGAGPFVMNTREEIEKAMRDYESGRFGAIPA